MVAERTCSGQHPVHLKRQAVRSHSAVRRWTMNAVVKKITPHRHFLQISENAVFLFQLLIVNNWQIFMQVELPKLRAADSALGHKEAFAVGQPCPPTTPERRVPDNGRLGSSDLHSVRFQALAKSWQAKSDVEKAAYVPP